MNRRFQVDVSVAEGGLYNDHGGFIRQRAREVNAKALHGFAVLDGIDVGQLQNLRAAAAVEHGLGLRVCRRGGGRSG